MPTTENNYTDLWIYEKEAKKYVKKFTKKIDEIRHQREVAIISKIATGSLYDCSIATGRFIPELPQVTKYTGMDYSEPFIEYLIIKTVTF